MNDPGTAGRTLTTAFRAIAAEDAALGASPAVGANVMAAFDRMTAARRRRRARMLETAVGLAAVLVAAVAIVRFRNTPDFRLQTSDFKSSREVTTAFMPLAYGSVPIVDGHVVRMEVPRASLVSFGLVPEEMIDIGDGTRGGTVIADVIIGDDGLARAVRFVRKLNRKESRR